MSTNYFFAMACWMLAAEKLLMVILGIRTEDQSLVYLVRLCAFLLIIVAIADKNRPGRRSKD